MKKKVIIQSELTPEHQDKIERIVLGSILINAELLQEFLLEFKTKLFTNPNNEIIAEVILNLNMTGSRIDLLTVTNALVKEKKLEEIGGVGYISGLTSGIGNITNFEVHLRLLQEFWLAKYLNECCSETQMDLCEYSKDVFDVYANMQSKLDNALKDLVHQPISTIKDVHHNLLKNGFEIIDGKIDSSGVRTGLERLDLLTNGFQPTDLIILAGRSGMGKTAFSLSILLEPTIKNKIPVAFFSLEMSKQQVVSRIQSMVSLINVSKIVKKQLSYEELNHIANSCRSLYDAPLYIDDSPNLSLLEFKSKARKLVRENKVRMIVIDYLQLMRSGIKTSSREQEVAEISKGLKAIAKELQVPVIALSQLSRNVEQRGGDKKPMLSDLRDSGQIEQDADMVLFCYRPEYYNQEFYNWFGTELNANNLFMLIVAKHRNGILGEIPLDFDGKYTKIADHRDNSNLYSDSERLSNIVPKDSKRLSNFVPENSAFQAESFGIKNPLIEQKNISDIDWFDNDNKTPF